jgi:hypothetical protein
MPTLFSVKIRTYSVILTLLLLTACATTQDQKMYTLDKSFNAYERALRWQDVDAVIAFHKNEHEKLTVEKRKYLKQFRVTSYNVVFSNVAADGNHASQIIELKYYKNDSMTIHELTINNKWEYDEKTQHWYLTNDLPDFK